MDRELTLEYAFELLKSEDWKERVQGEILELKMRIEKLAAFLSAVDLDKVVDDDEATYRMHLDVQLNAMSTYMDILIIRAITEKIPVSWIFEDEE